MIGRLSETAPMLQRPTVTALPSSLHQSERKARQPMGDVMAPYCWKISETLPFSDERLR